MKIRKVIDHSGIGELSLHMVLATKFFFYGSLEKLHSVFSVFFLT